MIAIYHAREGCCGQGKESGPTAFAVSQRQEFSNQISSLNNNGRVSFPFRLINVGGWLRIFFGYETIHLRGQKGAVRYVSRNYCPNNNTPGHIFEGKTIREKYRLLFSSER